MRRAKEAMGRASASGALVVALLTLSGGVPARAYDDTSTVTSLMSLFGAGGEEDNEKIVYRERSKLVLPPNGGRGLPEPQTRDSTRPASWPVDQEVVRRRGEQRPAPQSGMNENPNEPGGKRGPTKCLAATSEGNCTLVTEADDPLLGRGDAPSTRAAGQSSTRSFLTEPPAAFRQKVAGGKGVADSEKSSDWWNPGKLIGSVFGN